jgi:hypothetical protein
MAQKWEVSGDYLVEIWFRIEKDDSGYPKTKEWEQLLARPLSERVDYFQIASIPFYLKNISLGDIVRTKMEGKIFEFDAVLDRSGHNTYRLLLKTTNPDDPDFTTNELLEKGLSVEQQHGDFFAVDVPPSIDQQAIDAYSVAESESGRWDMQDGYLHTIKTHREP